MAIGTLKEVSYFILIIWDIWKNLLPRGDPHTCPPKKEKSDPHLHISTELAQAQTASVIASNQHTNLHILIQTPTILIWISKTRAAE